VNRLELKRVQHNQKIPPKLVSLISGKGGVGKSVLAFNLAERCAAVGQKVLLVDTDFNFGNQHILANVKCEYGIKEFIDGKLSLKEAVTRVSSQLDILPAVNSHIVFHDSDMPVYAKMIKNLRYQGTEYDLIIIDHSSGVSKVSTMIAFASDINLLVLVPELTSISDSYGLFKYLKETNKNINCRLLINRVQSEEEAEYIYSKFYVVAERFLKVAPQLMGFIPEDKLFVKSLAAQSPLSAIDAQSVVVQKLNMLGQELRRQLLNIYHHKNINNQKTNNKNMAVADIKE